VLSGDADWPKVKAGGYMCVVCIEQLASATRWRGFVWSMRAAKSSEAQAKDLGAIMDATRLAHSHVALHRTNRSLKEGKKERQSNLPGMISPAGR